MNQYDSEIASITSDVIKARRHLHMYPELNGQEQKTSRYIKGRLDSAGIPSEIVGATGVTGTILANESYPTFAVRAEIDALPITEQTGADYQSKNPGVMHACGHNGIAATALGLAALLNRHKELLKQNVKFPPHYRTITGKRASFSSKTRPLACLLLWSNLKRALSHSFYRRAGICSVLAE